jgi:hypothetical protein
MAEISLRCEPWGLGRDLDSLWLVSQTHAYVATIRLGVSIVIKARRELLESYIKCVKFSSFRIYSGVSTPSGMVVYRMVL